MEKSDIRLDLLTNGFDSYVFFTLSNKEVDLCTELNSKYDDIYCLVLKRLVHRSDHGVKWDEEDVLIKGYVFIYVPKYYDIRIIKSDNNPYRILNVKHEYGKLHSGDYEYAKWALEQNGIIGLSKAVKVNERVKIVSGPLQEVEGYIIKYDKRNRNCLVQIDFMNQHLRAWLPFEWTDQNYKM